MFFSVTLIFFPNRPPNLPSSGPRYATGPYKFLPETPPPPYVPSVSPRPSSSTGFFNDEDVYDSIEDRPLSKQPSVEYEDGYIHTVASVPQRNVLPGIAIGKDHNFFSPVVAIDLGAYCILASRPGRRVEKRPGEYCLRAQQFLLF